MVLAQQHGVVCVVVTQMSLRHVGQMPVVAVSTVDDFSKGGPPHAADISSVAGSTVSVRRNEAGRLLVSYIHPLLENIHRHVVLACHGGEIFAFDRKCYHVGFPLDLGPIEELHHVFPVATPIFKGSPKACARAAEGGEVMLRPAAICADDDDGNAPSGGSNEHDQFVCVQCTLHNRIFDLRSGDMISISVTSQLTDSRDPSAVCHATATSCRQRIHQVIGLRSSSVVTPRRSPPWVSIGPADGFVVVPRGEQLLPHDVIAFVDSFGHSNPIRPRGSASGRTADPYPGLALYVKGLQLPSDKQ